MHDIPAHVLSLKPQKNQRILVISDLHANLPYLKGLLRECAYRPEDILIFDGDFLEKGLESLNTLHYIMELYKTGNTYAIIGNCDFWYFVFREDFTAAEDEKMLSYVMGKKCGLLWDMINACGMNPFEIESFSECKRILLTAFRKEWTFLESLPHAIETDHYIFAHARVYPDRPLKEHTFWSLIYCDAFLNLGYSFSKWVIVGHWPVVLYSDKITNAAPIIDYQRKIISIDGGCVLENDGQLNALIIPEEGSEAFTWQAYDRFPRRKVCEAQCSTEKCFSIHWGDNRVRVLERGEEFSLCQHIRTGYRMKILTRYLFSEEEETECRDFTDYILPLHEGDTISIVEETSQGYYAKHEGVTGWYCGRLE